MPGPVLCALCIELQYVCKHSRLHLLFRPPPGLEMKSPQRNTLYLYTHTYVYIFSILWKSNNGDKSKKNRVDNCHLHQKSNTCSILYMYMYYIPQRRVASSDMQLIRRPWDISVSNIWYMKEVAQKLTSNKATTCRRFVMSSSFLGLSQNLIVLVTKRD